MNPGRSRPGRRNDDDFDLDDMNALSDIEDELDNMKKGP